MAARGKDEDKAITLRDNKGTVRSKFVVKATQRLRTCELDKLTDDQVYVGPGSSRHNQKANKWSYHAKPAPDETIQQYQDKYRTYLKNKPKLVAALPELRNKDLV